MLIALWSPKVGSGTSVVAAALALVAAARGQTRLVDFGGDQPAILGLPPLTSFPTVVDWLAGGASAPSEWLDEMAVPVAPGLSLLPGGPVAAAASPEAGAALAVAVRDSGMVIVDIGSGADPNDGAGRAVADVADAALVVLRPCYLGLRAAVADARLGSSAGVIVVEEPGRALDGDDVASVLGLPVIARVPRRADIARAVDAGVLRDRLPAALARPAETVLDGLVDLANGRWAA
jgi:MinD-like ATPase involved in chromosome partitioning or flagellar assembly